VVRPAPRAGFIWIEGRWIYNNHRWHWRDGHWVRHRGANYVYVPGRWDRRPNGYVWVEGRWRVRGGNRAIIRDRRR
jgi:hypothetical protein